MRIKEGVMPKYRIRKDLKSFKYGAFNKAYLGVVCEIVWYSPNVLNKVEISCPGKYCHGFSMSILELEQI